MWCTGFHTQNSPTHIYTHSNNTPSRFFTPINKVVPLFPLLSTSNFLFSWPSLQMAQVCSYSFCNYFHLHIMYVCLSFNFKGLIHYYKFKILVDLFWGKYLFIYISRRWYWRCWPWLMIRPSRKPLKLLLIF